MIITKEIEKLVTGTQPFYKSNNIHSTPLQCNNCSYIIGGAVPAELGEQDGKNAAASTVGLVNGVYN